MARYDDLNTRSIAYATLVSTIVLLIVVLLVQALTFNWLGSEEQRKLTATHYHSADKEIARQKQKLESYGPAEALPKPEGQQAEPAAEAKKDRYKIPLKQAQVLIMQESKKPAVNGVGT